MKNFKQTQVFFCWISFNLNVCQIYVSLTEKYTLKFPTYKSKSNTIVCLYSLSPNRPLDFQLVMCSHLTSCLTSCLDVPATASSGRKAR